MVNLLDDLKLNLIIEHDEDDYILQGFIDAAVNYAEGYQHVPPGFYNENAMPQTTKQAVIMLASHFYESRDGGTGGFFSDNVPAAQQAMATINDLLRLDREWKV